MKEIPLDESYKAACFAELGVTEEEARDWDILEVATGGVGLECPPLAHLKEEKK